LASLLGDWWKSFYRWYMESKILFALKLIDLEVIHIVKLHVRISNQFLIKLRYNLTVEDVLAVYT
jgi:hypothetical protein